MERTRPSSTAEMVCSWRALEALLPPGERIVSDPYARAFLGPGRKALLEAAELLPPRALKALFRRMDRAARGVIQFVLARHRAMDELLVAQDELEQVVILGAGYDSRALRLASQLGPAKVFEVDHPATAARKASLVSTAFGERPQAETIRVAVDFARDSWEERLLQAGFLPQRRTFWVWEGVTMYLEEGAVQETLRAIARLSLPGTLLTCDVWCPPENPLQRFRQRDLPSLAMRLLYEEPVIWSPAFEELEPFFRAQGFELKEAVLADDLEGRYGKRRRGLLEGGNSMVLTLAEVA